MKSQKLALAILASVAMFGCADADDSTDTPMTPCGNGICDNGETNATCPKDCPATQKGCGDGVCDILETILSCPQDCKAQCGNRVCEKEGGETYENCPQDCDAPGFCGDGLCNPLDNENTETCSLDCKKKVSCGDGTCSAGETRLNCPKDCPPVCGDGRCEAPEETDKNCPEDCENIDVEYTAVCGDGVCDEPDENKTNCPKDCEETPSQEGLKQLKDDEYYALQEGKYTFYYDYSRVKNPSKPVTGETEAQKSDRMFDDFFAFPFPSELRTDKYGRQDIKNYPLPSGESILKIVASIPLLNTVADLVPALVERVQSERKGFSPIGATYFRTTVSLDNKSFPEPADTVKADSCFQMINVEKDSRHYGERVPLDITYHRGQKTGVWASNTLVLRPVPGAAANPGDRYVTLVTNCLTSNGRVLSQPNKLRYVLAKAAPDDINKKMEYYVDRLSDLEKDGKLGFAMKDIRAMTGFQVSNAADEMDQIAKDLKGRGKVVTDAKGVAKGEWVAKTISNYETSKLNVYIFHGTYTTANYIDGSFPYIGKNEGQYTFDENGKLVSKPKEETVRFSVVVPRTKMPDKGWPIAVYGHGTGGDADSHCRYGNDEGVVLINGAYNHYYYDNKPTDIAVPMAMIGIDAVLHGTRGDGKIVTTVDLIPMILRNPVIIRESWRQTVADMLVLYDILDNNKLVLPPIPDSGDKRNVIFDSSYGLYMGHSQGAQEAGLLLGLTGSIKNAFLSAGGGGILLSFVDLHPDLGDIQVIGNMLKGKSAADLLGFVLGLQDGDISYDSFITNHIVQPLLDPIDPLNYTRRFVMEPPAGWQPKNIAQTIGLGDQSTPQAAQFAMISSIGLPPIGKLFEVAEPMKLVGFTKSTSNAVMNNITNLDGKTATGASMQFNYTGTDNPHFVIYRMNSARNAYINFFRSVVVDGKPKVAVSGSQEGEN